LLRAKRINSFTVREENTLPDSRKTKRIFCLPEIINGALIKQEGAFIGPGSACFHVGTAFALCCRFTEPVRCMEMIG